MGHKRIDETMIYVHVAEHHRRELPELVMSAGDCERDPDKRILAMLAARHLVKADAETAANEVRGSQVAAEGGLETKRPAVAGL